MTVVKRADQKEEESSVVLLYANYEGERDDRQSGFQSRKMRFSTVETRP